MITLVSHLIINNLKFFLYLINHTISLSSSSKTEVVKETAFVLGALEKVNMDQDDHDVLIKRDVETVTKKFGPFEYIWTFKRCCVNGSTLHSEAYKKVTVRINYTVRLIIIITCMYISQSPVYNI